MDCLEFVVNGGLALQVLTVQSLDELMSWLLALEVRVVAIAEVELAAGGRVVADPPAARFVTVVLLEQRVDGCADRAENAELFKVRAEPGPEPVIGSGLVDGARVYLKPVAHQPCVLEPDAQTHDDSAGHKDGDDRTPLHFCSAPGRQPAARHAGGSGARMRSRSRRCRPAAAGLAGRRAGVDPHLDRRSFNWPASAGARADGGGQRGHPSLGPDFRLPWSWAIVTGRTCPPDGPGHQP